MSRSEKKKIHRSYEEYVQERTQKEQINTEEEQPDPIQGLETEIGQLKEVLNGLKGVKRLKAEAAFINALRSKLENQEIMNSTQSDTSLPPETVVDSPSIEEVSGEDIPKQSGRDVLYSTITKYGISPKAKKKILKEIRPTAESPFSTSDLSEHPAGYDFSSPLMGRTRRSSYESAKFLDPSPYTEEMKAVFGENVVGEILPPLESNEATNPTDCEMFDAIREHLKIYRIQERTIVYAVVVSKELEQNESSAIRCYGGVAFGGYARDATRDAYLVNCAEYISVGTVPFALQVAMKKVGDWKIKIPIPEKVLEKAFTPQQRKLMQMYREKYPAEKYDIHYLQMLGAN